MSYHTTGSEPKWALPAPTLYPTELEFSDPITYLNSPEILDIGLKYGIVKVKPPRCFNPPFCLNLNTFKFHTRIQNLSELNLFNRSKDFWLVGFNNYVHTFDIKLTGLQTKLGIDESEASPNNLSGFIRLRNKQMVHLYSIFSEPNVDQFAPFIADSDLKIFELLKSYRQYLDKILDEEESEDAGANNSKDFLNFKHLYKPKKYHSTSSACEVCGGNDNPDKILLCDGEDCHKIFHMDCLNPKLTAIPKNDWFCKECIKGSNNDYGFEEDFDSIFTINEFKKRCDKFKRNYFKNQANPSVNTIETEFWKLVNNSEYLKGLNVNYGADIHNTAPEEISGFPTRNNTNIEHFRKYYTQEQFETFLKHDFSLPNLPFAKGSLLNYIGENKSTSADENIRSNDSIISGMTVPWIYIGSLFSTFCWHKEDHYTLSANYCHVGATKKWYGIPARHCDLFEEVFYRMSPDYFKKQPDLLHQLVSLVSPEDLINNAKLKMNQDLEVYYVDQNPGEYVITYPKVYHAGFNCGFNVNEAVNFTMPSWIKQGSLAVEEYKLVKRDNVFNNFKLLKNILDEFNDAKDTMYPRRDIFNDSTYKSLIKSSFVEICSELGNANKLLIPEVRNILKKFTTIEVENESKSAHTENHSRMRFKKVNQNHQEDEEDENLCHECRTSLNFLWFEIDTLKEILEEYELALDKQRYLQQKRLSIKEESPMVGTSSDPESESQEKSKVDVNTTPVLKQEGYQLPTPQTSPGEMFMYQESKVDRESEFQRIIDEARQSVSPEDSFNDVGKRALSDSPPPAKRLRKRGADKSTFSQETEVESEASNESSASVRKSKRIAKIVKTQSDTKDQVKSQNERDQLAYKIAREQQAIYKAKKRREKYPSYGKHLLCLADFQKLYLNRFMEAGNSQVKTEQGFNYHDFDRLLSITTLYKENDPKELTDLIIKDIQPKLIRLLSEK